MGKHFGELIKLRGVITFVLSPYEQKAFKGFFSEGFPNLVRRFKSQVFYVAPPFIGGYLIVDWASNEHQRLKRKNPADYADEV